MQVRENVGEKLTGQVWGVLLDWICHGRYPYLHLLVSRGIVAHRKHEAAWLVCHHFQKIRREGTKTQNTEKE